MAEFGKEETRANIGKHLLKTQCTEIVNEMFQFVAEENMIKVKIRKYTHLSSL